MAQFQPDRPSRGNDGDNSLDGRSMSVAERISLSGLSRESPEFARGIASLCLLIHARSLVIMDESARCAVLDLDLFEWSKPYPPGMPSRNFPYFTADHTKHVEIQLLENEYLRLRRANARGPKFLPCELPINFYQKTPISNQAALETIEQKIENSYQELLRRNERGINVPDGRLRPTDFGENFIPLIDGKPLDIGAQILRIIMRAEEVAGKATRRPMVEHMSELWDIAGNTQANKGLRLQSFNRHLRKLGVALIEGGLSFDRSGLETRAKQILAEGHVDTYLAEARTKTQQSRHAQAYKWLRSFELGQHGSVPFASWQPHAKDESFNEAYKIVARARHQSYHSFNRLRMESRSLGGQMPLFREFAMDVFDDVRFVRGDNIDIPPGRGTIMSGARLEKLFFALSREDDLLRGYRDNESQWFADQLLNLEHMTVVALRQWIGVTAPSPEFNVLKERYYYVVDNDHFSGSYGFAFGFPASVVDPKLRQASYGMDGGPDGALDASMVMLSIPALIEASEEANKNYLMLGHMSPLFGGMCNALPVGSEPVFGWEGQHQGTAWRDAYGHVHWPWLVWSYKDKRPRVDETVRPLAAADWEIRNFAISGQKLFEAFRHRYGAWKNDQTPGLREAPRMLVRAYDIYREHLERGAAGKEDETVYIGILDRTNPRFDPVPLLNCFSLELMAKHLNYKVPLPSSGNGSGKIETSLWRRHIQPLIERKIRDGGMGESSHELVIIGENDIKRS